MASFSGGAGVRERPGASAPRASSLAGPSVSASSPSLPCSSGRPSWTGSTGDRGRHSSQQALSVSPSLLPSSSWEALLERRQQEQLQAAHDRELIIAQEAVKTEVDRRLQEMREEGRIEKEEVLSDGEEEWLCTQFTGFERTLLRQTVRSYPTAPASLSSLSSSLSSSAIQSCQSPSPRRRRGESDRSGEAHTLSSKTAPNTRFSPATRASTKSSSSGSAPRAGLQEASANGAVWSLLLPFSHWLGVSWAPAPMPPTSGGSSSLLVPQVHRKKAQPRRPPPPSSPPPSSPSPSSLAVPFSVCFSAAAKLFERRRRVRQREKAFLQEQEKRDEELRAKVFDRTRKRKRTSRNASGSCRRGCDAVALPGEEESSCSEDEEMEGEASRKTDARDEKSRSALEEASDGVSVHPDTATAQKADCTRLMSFDYLSCPLMSSLSDEKLPRSLLRFLRRRGEKGQKKGDESEEADREVCPTRGGVCTPHGSRTFALEGGGKKVEETPEDSEDDTAAAVPLLTRRVHQRMSQLPCSNAKAKNNLLHYLLAAHSLEWKAALLSGYSVLVEGFGSKKLLLDRFAHQALRDGVCCVVEGYRREVRLQHCLSDLLVFLTNSSSKALASPHTRQASAAASQGGVALVSPAAAASKGEGEAASKRSSPFLSLEKLVKEVKALAKQLSVPLYFVVHNIDAPPLRGEACRAFASLAACSNIYLIGSADHHMHGLLFDGAELRSLSCLYYRCHTYMDYREEVLGHWGSTGLFMPLWLRNCAGAGGFASSDGGAGGVWGSGVNFAAVVAALTTNHKRLLKCVAERQLEQLKRGEGRAVSLEALSDPLFAMAGNLDRTKILQLLVELTSHGAAVKTAVGGQEALSIRATPAQLEQLLAILEQYGI
ncbi:origin recognition complex subunit 2 protein [Toxoplasma gondii ME49]|uniref:Origin recognition complex subunit 2 protein n=1 Tax=Toxoplasma gondii (strain ATCC 50611 / Me49) TaxID=508771 RepID=S8ENF1_TOXGM|nr:origin recognition complex subunit 2 protein [Toxoplasma gondii ME49]EPT24801.1 origin recognition complex subunit 2 protein [Toxoplasma gondii ME49]|eukprot:XP_002366987.1 origin recognition complex subunit 2 protein [Toxoplasma gondii ME49]